MTAHNALYWTSPCLIQLFAGYGSQALALDYLGIPFESWRISEWAIPSIKAYKDLHHSDAKGDYSRWTDDETIIEWLDGRISSNYNTPLAREQIKRMGEAKRRRIFSAMAVSRNLGSITKIHGPDLAIEDTDRYTYLMFYSFPCQDLSVAGKGAGCARGSGTRSGLLWEVERLLDELNAEDSNGKHLPQVLIAENVPSLLAEKNRPDFYEWLRKLESLGYHNYYKILNAKNFGIPQNRDRVFLVSIMGDYYFDFPRILPQLHCLYEFVDFDPAYLIDPRKLNETQKKCIAALANKGISKTLRTSGASSYDRHLWRVYSVELRQSESFIKGKCQYYIDESRTICANHLASYTIDGKVFYDYSPREVFRLMGVKDEDYEKVAAGQSKSSMYHLAGDSIVTAVLMALFGELLGIEWQSKVKDLADEITGAEYGTAN